MCKWVQAERFRIRQGSFKTGMIARKWYCTAGASGKKNSKIIARASIVCNHTVSLLETHCIYFSLTIHRSLSHPIQDLVPSTQAQDSVSVWEWEEVALEFAFPESGPRTGCIADGV